MSKTKAKSTKKQKELGLPLNLLKGITVGILAFCILILICSLIVLKTAIESKYFFLLMFAASALSVFIGAASTCRSAGSRKLIAGMLTTAILLGIQFVILFCFNSAALSNSIYFIIPIDMIFGFLGCVAGANIRK